MAAEGDSAATLSSRGVIDLLPGTSCFHEAAEQKLAVTLKWPIPSLFVVRM